MSPVHGYLGTYERAGDCNNRDMPPWPPDPYPCMYMHWVRSSAPQRWCGGGPGPGNSNPDRPPLAGKRGHMSVPGKASASRVISDGGRASVQGVLITPPSGKSRTSYARLRGPLPCLFVHNSRPTVELSKELSACRPRTAHGSRSGSGRGSSHPRAGPQAVTATAMVTAERPNYRRWLAIHVGSASSAARVSCRRVNIAARQVCKARCLWC